MAATLKPCPFCGARGRRLAVRCDEDEDVEVWVVECDNCSAAGPAVQPGVDTDGNYTKAEAIRAWNTRA